jgi:hypothetical protein
MGPSQVVDGLRRSVSAPIGWAQRPSGGRTRELAWTSRPTPPPGQGVSNPTGQSRPNHPGRTCLRTRRRPRRRTSARRRRARPRRRPAGSRPTDPARPLRHRVPATVVPRRLLGRPATIAPTPGPMRPPLAGSQPSAGRSRPCPGMTPERHIREAGSLHRPRRPGKLPTPVGLVRRRRRSRRSPGFPRPRRPKRWSTGWVGNRRGRRVRRPRATPGPAAPLGSGGGPETARTARRRDPRRRPPYGKRSRAGARRSRSGARRSRQGVRRGRLGAKPSRPSARRNRPVAKGSRRGTRRSWSRVSRIQPRARRIRPGVGSSRLRATRGRLCPRRGRPAA